MKKMNILRTPDHYFANLVDYPFAPNYTTISTHDGSDMRIHHLDEGPGDGPVVVCMHGQPVWSYLYRKITPLLVEEGIRVIAPDLPGYGKSDKPAALEDYSYQRQVDWMGEWLENNDFSGITFFGQDWGGLIGLRLVVDHPDRFDRVVIANTGLPYNPDVPDEVVREVEDFRANAKTPSLLEMQQALSQMPGNQAVKFAYWQKFCWETEHLPIGFMMSMMLEKHSKHNVKPGSSFRLSTNPFSAHLLITIPSPPGWMPCSGKEYPEPEGSPIPPSKAAVISYRKTHRIRSQGSSST